MATIRILLALVCLIGLAFGQQSLITETVNEPQSSDAGQLPLVPQNLHAVEMRATTAKLGWELPALNGALVAIQVTAKTLNVANIPSAEGLQAPDVAYAEDTLDMSPDARVSVPPSLASAPNGYVYTANFMLGDKPAPTSAVLENLKPSCSYEFSVKLTMVNQSTPAVSARAVAFTTPLSPSGLVQTANGPDSFTVEWSSPSGLGTPLMGYRVSAVQVMAASPDSDKQKEAVVVGSVISQLVSADQLSATVKNPLNVTDQSGPWEYKVWVTAVNEGGDSVESSALFVETACPAPQGLNLVSSTPNSLVLSWSLPPFVPQPDRQLASSSPAAAATAIETSSAPENLTSPKTSTRTKRFINMNISSGDSASSTNPVLGILAAFRKNQIQSSAARRTRGNMQALTTPSAANVQQQPQVCPSQFLVRALARDSTPVESVVSASAALVKIEVDGSATFRTEISGLQPDTHYEVQVVVFSDEQVKGGSVSTLPGLATKPNTTEVAQPQPAAAPMPEEQPIIVGDAPSTFTPTTTLLESQEQAASSPAPEQQKVEVASVSEDQEAAEEQPVVPDVLAPDPIMLRDVVKVRIGLDTSSASTLIAGSALPLTFNLEVPAPSNGALILCARPDILWHSKDIKQQQKKVDEEEQNASPSLKLSLHDVDPDQNPLDLCYHFKQENSEGTVVVNLPHADAVYRAFKNETKVKVAAEGLTEEEKQKILDEESYVMLIRFELYGPFAEVYLPPARASFRIVEKVQITFDPLMTFLAVGQALDGTLYTGGVPLPINTSLSLQFLVNGVPVLAHDLAPSHRAHHGNHHSNLEFFERKKKSAVINQNGQQQNVEEIELFEGHMVPFSIATTVEMADRKDNKLSFLLDGSAAPFFEAPAEVWFEVFDTAEISLQGLPVWMQPGQSVEIDVLAGLPIPTECGTLTVQIVDADEGVLSTAELPPHAHSATMKLTMSDKEGDHVLSTTVSSSLNVQDVERDGSFVCGALPDFTWRFHHRSTVQAEKPMRKIERTQVLVDASPSDWFSDTYFPMVIDIQQPLTNKEHNLRVSAISSEGESAQHADFSYHLDLNDAPITKELLNFKPRGNSHFVVDFGVSGSAWAFYKPPPSIPLQLIKGKADMALIGAQTTVRVGATLPLTVSLGVPVPWLQPATTIPLEQVTGLIVNISCSDGQTAQVLFNRGEAFSKGELTAPAQAGVYHLSFTLEGETADYYIPPIGFDFTVI